MIIFILQFVNMVYHIELFAYIEESLHPWDKSHLIVLYHSFIVSLDFFEGFLVHVHQEYWSVVFFLCDICVCFDIMGWWLCRMSLEVFLPLQFLQRV